MEAGLPSTEEGQPDAPDASSGTRPFKMYLAPMVRCSTTPLRTLALHYGADACYTEEMIDRSILDSERIERSVEVRDADGRRREYGVVDYVRSVTSMSARQAKRAAAEGSPVLLRIVPELERGRLVYQIGSGDDVLAARAALKVYRDVSGININMGCPKKFSTSGGMGAALLSDPQRAFAIVRSVRAALPPDVPVSAKIRLLRDTAATVDFVRGLVEAGANMIAVHARTAGMRETEDALWERVRPVLDAVRSYGGGAVEAVYNGDLYTREDMVRAVEVCGADAVMLARPVRVGVRAAAARPGRAGGVRAARRCPLRHAGS